MNTMWHKIKEVKTMPDKVLKVAFESGETKVYDIKPLAKIYKNFEPLADTEKTLFGHVELDNDRCNLSWNYDILLSNSELWFNGYDV